MKEMPHMVAAAFWAVYVISAVAGQSLQYVSKVALDRNRRLHHPYTVRAIYAEFQNTQSVWVQLWEPEDLTNLTSFQLRWQHRITPRYGNGSAEIIDLTEREYAEIGPNYKLGIINDAIPGPVLGTYLYGNGVVLSLFDRFSYRLPLEEGESYGFDDLLLPYHIPVFVCNVTGCPYYVLHPPTIVPPTIPDIPPTQASGNQGDGSQGDGNPGNQGGKTGGPLIAASTSGDTSWLRSTEVMIGLLAWNVVLTIFILALVIALIAVCGDLENLKRKWRRRQRQLPGYGDHDNISFRAGGDLSTPSSTGHKLREGGWRLREESWHSDSVPSTSDDHTKLTPASKDRPREGSTLTF